MGQRTGPPRVTLIVVLALGLATPLLAPAHSGIPFGLPSDADEAASAAQHAPAGLWWETWSRAGAASGIDAAIERIEHEGLDAALAPNGLPLYHVQDSLEGTRYNVFLRYARTPTTEDHARLEDAFGATRGIRTHGLAQAAYVPRLTRVEIDSALALPGVVAVELERLVLPALDTAAASALVVPHPNLGHGARTRWDATGRGAVIAILDTGIEKTHEAIPIEHYLGGYNATVPTGRIGTELLETPTPTWTDLNTMDPTDDSANGHGTHVAGIALGADPADVYVGMAPDAKYIDVKIFARYPVGIPNQLPIGPGGLTGTPYGWGSYVLEGMEFVRSYNAGESHLGDPGADRIDIALFAFGELEPDMTGDSILSHATNRLVDTGVIVVAAAGNCGPRTTTPCTHAGPDSIVAPGAARQAITVGSLNHNRTVDLRDEVVSGFSSLGPNGGEAKPNLMGYGEPIIAPVNQKASNGTANAYLPGMGTSQAAAQIAGIVALLVEVAPDLTAAEAKQILMATARDKGPRGWDPTYGAGAVNALFAVGVAFGVLDATTTQTDENGQDIADRVPPQNETPRPVVRVNRSPVASFSHRPSAPVVGESIVFIDSSVDPERDKIVAFNWDFGDGNTAKGPRTAHTYTRPGEYRVVLTATDMHGDGGSASVRIVVNAPPDTKEGAAAGFLVLIVVVCIAAIALRDRARRA